MPHDLSRYVAIALICISLSASVFFVLNRLTSKQSTQADFSRQLAHLAKIDCQEIEALKTNVRIQAISNQANLAKNARLLGITVTPALIKQENIDTNKILATYAPKSC